MSFEINYTYNHAPTLRRFAESDTRLRCIIGPFGCLDKDTEFLTPTGWKKISEYGGEDVGEFNAQTTQLEFRKPQEYIKLSCSEFYWFKNRNRVDMMLSEEHTVVYDTRFRPGEFQSISAPGLFDKHNSLSDGFSGRIPNTWKAPERVGVDLTEDELRLTVALCADGSIPHRGDKSVITLRKDRKKLRLRDLLIKCGIEVSENYSPNRPTEGRFSFVPPVKTKSLSDFYDATEDQLRVIVDEVKHWDGHVVGRDGNTMFFSTKKADADFVQYALASLGYRASIRIPDPERYAKKGWNQCYIVSWSETDQYPYSSLRGAPKAEVVKSEDGFKYCFTTTTGYFVARRNNKIFVTGNSGKSSACVMEILRRAQEQAPAADGIRYTRWAVIRNTFPQLNDTTIKTFFDWLPPKYFGSYHKTEHRYIIDKIPNCHIEILFRALDQEEHVSNLLSMELTGAWINEVREIPSFIFEALDGRIGRYPPARLGGVTWRGICMDTNPPVEGSWLYELIENTAPDNLEAFKQPSGLSSEAENLPFLDKGQEYYRELAKGKDQDYVDVYIHGKYGRSLLGKPVYTGFNSSLHIASSPILPIENAEIILGMDFGVSEQAAIIAQLHPMGFFYVLDEVITENMGLRQFAEHLLYPLLKTKYRKNPVTGYGDPAGVRRSDIDETTCYEELKNIGVTLLPAHTNAPGSRIGAVDTLLNKLIMGKPAFQVSPNCKGLIDGFRGGYRYKRIGANYHPIPEKNKFSHCLVGDTKISTPTGEKLIADIRVGDYVTTPVGPRKVTAVMWRESDELVEILFSNGKRIICTSDHPFITLEGIVLAKDLKNRNVIGRGTKEEELWVEQQSMITKNSINSVITESEVKVVQINSYPGPGVSRVYDLTVEDQHVFFAEQVLSSNCHDALQYCALYIDQNDVSHKKKVPMVFKRYRVPSRAGY